VTASAFSQSPGDREDSARKHFAQGVENLEAGRYDAALREFEAAQADSNSPKIVLNIATTLRQLRRFAEAANAYARYLKHPERDPERATEVEQILAELDRDLCRVSIHAPTGSTVTVDGTRVELDAQSRAVYRVSPGSHMVAAELPGGLSATKTLEVAAGSERSVELSPVSGPEPREPKGEPARESPARDQGVVREREQAPGSHASAFGFTVRADFDGKARGLVFAPGVLFDVSRYVEIGAAALIGKRQGAWAGARALLPVGALKPSLLVGAPVFFVQGVRPGVQGAVGLVWDPSQHFGVSADLGVAHFFSPPPDYEATVFVPSVGLRTWL
jgi:hypothetical protein